MKKKPTINKPSREFIFTFENLKNWFSRIQNLGYSVLTCAQYAKLKSKRNLGRIYVNRIDVDFSIRKAERVAKILNELNIRGTFFIRLHAPEYNPFSFENYRILRWIADTGHEIGYHSEVVDQAAIWNESAETCLLRDLQLMKYIFKLDVEGAASHGGLTGLNNLDFWQTRCPKAYGLLYEAYDRDDRFGLFWKSRYVSDSSWSHWKSYENGERLEGNTLGIAETAEAGVPLIYGLIHPDTYYDRHIYE